MTEKVGNPNLLWKADESGLYVIDHSLIFDNALNKVNFWDAHVFKSLLINKQDDLLEKISFEARMKKTLPCWQSAWGKIPKE